MRFDSYSAQIKCSICFVKYDFPNYLFSIFIISKNVLNIKRQQLRNAEFTVKYAVFKLLSDALVCASKRVYYSVGLKSDAIIKKKNK